MDGFSSTCFATKHQHPTERISLEAQFPARQREERGCGPVTGKDRASCQSGGAPALRPGAPPSPHRSGAEGRDTRADACDSGDRRAPPVLLMQISLSGWDLLAFYMCQDRGARPGLPATPKSPPTRRVPPRGPSQPEGKIGLPRANPRGRPRFPS